jgi:hypothetical protein
MSDGYFGIAKNCGHTRFVRNLRPRLEKRLRPSYDDWTEWCGLLLNSGICNG